MSVITFYNNGEIETAQTTSIAAISTYLSVEQNYKILLIDSKYNNTTLQNCFWEQTEKVRTDLETGIGGLTKALMSNKTSPEIITNYTRVVFKKRLEVLAGNNILNENYENYKKYMKNIIRMANKYYDLIFIDANGGLGDSYIQDILKESNLIVLNTSQRMKYIKEAKQLKRTNELFNKNNTIFLIGKYDAKSKFNIKNIQRLENMQEIYQIPYNTMLFERSNEGKMADFIIDNRKAKPNSVNGPAIEAISEVSMKIIEKLKELQMQF